MGVAIRMVTSTANDLAQSASPSPIHPAPIICRVRIAITFGLPRRSLESWPAFRTGGSFLSSAGAEDQGEEAGQCNPSPLFSPLHDSPRCRAVAAGGEEPTIDRLWNLSTHRRRRSAAFGNWNRAEIRRSG